MDVDSSELQATDVAAQPGHVFKAADHSPVEADDALRAKHTSAERCLSN